MRSCVFSERTEESLLITDSISQVCFFPLKLFSLKKKRLIWIKRVTFIQLKFNLKRLPIAMVATELSFKL